MREMTYAEALAEAVYDSLADDPAVTLVWGSMMGLAGAKLMAPVRNDFADRILDPPISEAALAGIGVGAALAGARPIIPFGTASFMFRAWDQILHEAGVARYMSNGAATAPMVFHALHGIRGGGAPQHSQSPQAMAWNAPGIEIVLASTPADIKGLFRSAVKSDNPTVVLDHARLMGIKGPVPDGDYDIPFGVADIKRKGGDVTVVATSWQVHTALAAAEVLARDGIEAEIVDLRTLVPLDTEAILASLLGTGRLVVVDECAPRCSVASEIAATVAEEGFDLLKAPIRRVMRADAPVPFSPTLEDRMSPRPADVVDAVRSVMG